MGRPKSGELSTKDRVLALLARRTSGWVSTGAIKERLGLGLMPVREACRRLETEGKIAHRKGGDSDHAGAYEWKIKAQTSSAAVS